MQSFILLRGNTALIEIKLFSTAKRQDQIFKAKLILFHLQQISNMTH